MASGRQIEGSLERLESVVCLLDAKARLLQPLGEQHSTVAVIFDQQNDRPLG